MILFTSTTKHSGRIFSKKVGMSYLYSLLLSLLMFLMVVASVKGASGGAGATPVETPSAVSVSPVRAVLPGEEFYRQGVDFEERRDYVHAMEMYEKAIRENHPRAQYNAGVLCFNGKGVPSNKGRAIDLFTRAAQNHHPRAQFNLAKLYEEGTDVKIDEEQARYWYGQSADQGFKRAKVHLAVMLEEGRGGKADARESDLAQAISIYQSLTAGTETVDKKDLDSINLARTNLSKYYLRGIGVAQDQAAAIALLERAAESGYDVAQFNLGIIHEHYKRYELARKYLRDAAVNGYEKAYYFLGRMFEDGLGGEKKEDTAKHYYLLAANVNTGTNYSPLQFAAKEGRLHALQIMVEAGGNLLAVNRDGMNALKLAIKYGHEAVIDFIQRKMESPAEEKVRRELASQAEAIAQLRLQLETLSPGRDEEMRAIRERLDPLAKKYAAEEEIEKAKAYIKSQPNLRTFYRQFQMRLEEFFLAYKVLNTGLVSKDDDSINKLATGIALAGELVPFPGVGGITKVIGKAINYAHNYQEKLKVAMVSNLIENVTEMDRALEEAARVLALMYEPQIADLTEEGTKTLSERGVRRIVEYVRAGSANDKDPLGEQIALAIATARSVPGPFAFLDKAIQRKAGMAPWTDTEIFQLSGIETSEGKRYVSDTTKVDRVLYRRGPKTLAEKLGFYEVPDLSTAGIQVMKTDGTLEEIRDFAQLAVLRMTTEDLARAYRAGAKVLGSVGGGAAAAASGGAASSAGAAMATAAPLPPVAAATTGGGSITAATTSGTAPSTAVTVASTTTSGASGLTAAAPAAASAAGGTSGVVGASTAPVIVPVSTITNPLVTPAMTSGPTVVGKSGAVASAPTVTASPKEGACANCCVIQ